MTDGPHKSLPLKRPWKKVAECAWNPVTSSDQIAEHISYALFTDIDRLTIDLVVKELCSISDSLFGDNPGDLISCLDSLRFHCPGSPSGQLLIDSAIEQVASGFTGDIACRVSLTTMLEETAKSNYRATEEHWLRQMRSENAMAMRDRMSSANSKVNFEEIASRLLTPGAKARGAIPARKSGLDEGVPL